VSKSLRVFSLVVAALSLTMTSAHVLELPQKLSFSASTYALVNGTLYRWFAIVGGIYTVVAIAAAWALTWAARRVPSAFAWACAGAALLSLGFVSWLTLVMPVNNAIGRASLTTPEALPSLWIELRGRWEYGHLIGFVLDLLGFCSLAVAAVADAPAALVSPVHASASVLIRAPRESVFGLYAGWQNWPRIFWKTIRGVRLLSAEGSAREIEVAHVEGRVPNRLQILSRELIVLEERKRRFNARFENRFESVAGGTRYVVTADVTLLGSLRWLRLIARPIVVSRIRRFVLEPMRVAAEADALNPGAPSQRSA
jgi:hypothetical protein